MVVERTYPIVKGSGMMKTIGQNIRDLDNQIGELLSRYEQTEEEIEKTIIFEEIENLTKIRKDLKASKVEGSNSSVWVSGAISIATVVLIMKYEERDVIATKAFNIATRIFKN